MKIIVVPPLRLNEANGARTRTLEVYSRIGSHIDITFAVDRSAKEETEKHYLELLKGHKTVDAYTGRNPIRLLFSFIKLVRQARRMDAVFCYANYKPSVLYSYLVASLSQKPLIITIHIVEDSARNRGYLMNKAFQYSRGLLALDNGKIVQELTAMFPGKRIAPIRNGVDYDIYASGEYPGEKVADCIFVGVLTERKGDQDLIEIWKRVQSSLPEARLIVLAGVTPKQRVDTFKACALERGIKDGIKVLGYVSEEDKIDMYRRSSTFLLPSKDEGMALVIPEALAAGLPVVIWDLPQFDIIKKGTVKIPYKDFDRFAAEVCRLLTDKDHRETITREGQQFAEANLSWDAAAVQEASSIEELDVMAEN